MSELRKDPVVNRWVIIAPERGVRPREFSPGPRDEDPLGPDTCPFCEYNERMTPPELFAIRDNGEPNRPGWYVRVVPTKYPALRLEGEVVETCDGLLCSTSGIGAQEVLIENPRHDVDLALAPEDQIMRVLTACRVRYAALRQDPRFRHVLVYRNHRQAAGATIGHPHSQVMALPIVPKQVWEQVEAAARYHVEHQRCIFCELLSEELARGERVIAQSSHFVALAPFASRVPYEAVLYPRRHAPDLQDLEPMEQADLASLLRRLLLAYRAALYDPPYKMVLQTGPQAAGHPTGIANEVPPELCYHWHLQIIPCLGEWAGLEWGTGFPFNTVAPEEAATLLRNSFL